MFGAAELGQKISKEIYKKEEPKLRQELLSAQYELKKQSKFPVIVLIAGVDGAGKGETVNLLNEWMDPRYIETRAFGLPNEVEHAMPHMWRFWMNMPAMGRIGIFFGHWYTAPILERAYGDIKTAELDAALSEIRHFEKMPELLSAKASSLATNRDTVKDRDNRIQEGKNHRLCEGKIREQSNCIIRELVLKF